MPKLWSYFVFLLWVSYLMAGGLFLFIDGFFLTRISRPEKTNCTPCLSCSPESLLENLTSFPDICLPPRARVVLLVIDALKYDFLKWTDSPPDVNFHRNKVPIVHRLLTEEPTNARLFKSIADPPTTTMQRIKALTTGTLPTFIDISSSFSTGEIDEDNLIEQNNKNGVVFMGDDTWTGLFPDKFLRQFPSPSFNVFDLDTVDRDVRNRIFFELQRKDWSLLVAHTLGVDHCGHKHGQNHPEMIRKLNETNELINEIVQVLDNHTVLFVVGDHGMTESGDHGGDSPSEVEAAMFVYSKRPLQDQTQMENFRTVNQVDIVPTFSAILGTPIPFSNIGAVILDALPKFRNGTVSEHPWYTVNAVWRNVVQTKRYIEAYSSDTYLFTEEKLETLDKLYKDLQEHLKNMTDNKSLHTFLETSTTYFKYLRDSCLEIWVQFDANLMSQGLVLSFCILFFMYLILTGIPQARMLKILESSFLRISLAGNLAGAFIVYTLYSLKILEDFKNTNFFVSGVISVSLLAILVIQNWDVISDTWYTNSKHKKYNYFLRVILGLTICGLFSNSYVVHEDKVLSFLLITLIWVLVYTINDEPENLEKKHKRSKPYQQRIFLITLGFIISVSIRASSYFWRCREEQLGDSCTTVILGKVGSMTSNNFERVLLIFTLVGLALYITIVRMWLSNCGNLSGFSPSTTLARYCHPLMVVCMGSYWVIQRLPKDPRIKFVFAWQMNGFALVVYCCVILAVVVIFVKPLQVFLLPRNRDSLNVYQGENIVPKLFDKVKELFYNRKRDGEDDIPVVYGLGTVYSAAFVSLGVFGSLIYALLLGNVLAPSVLLLVVTGTVVLGIVAVERFRNANDISELMHVPDTAIFCWFLIAEYFFYGTGHQPTFPTIYWDAAFVGTGGHYYGNIIPAVLIGINTFGSHLLMGLTLPLLIISPFTIFVMIPKLAKVKFRVDEDMKRGELILFDKDSAFQTAVFNTSSRYLLFHGFRVFACMFAATIHCRHLMVWKIFAPKLIFEGLSFLVTLGSILASFFLVIRIDNQVEKLITRVTKASVAGDRWGFHGLGATSHSRPH
ncbi:GPI ethanolamine phosphate transferase 3 [Diachasma alloeum]|uniref:GPI ethanolamine phosphate transferase 3 n=1 Tax=Diachasma alloeum TaxID=454923 RepID=UPI0007383FA2|nr:GPI ethanolamine phosphate transferase 3 [Diachasma alloeum]